MSVPYGQSPATQQPGPPSSSAGPGLGNIFAIAAGGLGLVIYLLSFSDDVGAYLRTGLVGVLLLGGALLATASVLPKEPATLVPAAVLMVTGTLFLLIDVTNGPAFLGAAGEAVGTPGLVVFALVLAFLASAACVMALLVHAGVVTMTRRPSPYPQPSWGPPPAGYPGAGYPGQQPVGSPSGGFAQPPQQPYVPPTAGYGHQAPYSPPHGQYPDRPYPDRQYGEPGQYSEPDQFSEQPTQITGQPIPPGNQPAGDQPDRPDQYGDQQPGTPPGR